MNLSESEMNKTLYLCFVECRVSYVVRSIKLSQLLRSNHDFSVLQLTEVAHKPPDGRKLAASVGCGMFGSQILFAGGVASGGVTPATYHRSCYRKEVYALDTDDSVGSDSELVKMDGKLIDGKVYPIVAVVGGKLIAHSYRRTSVCSFEVFDPEMKTWRALPEPPFWGYFWESLVGYAIIGLEREAQDADPIKSLSHHPLSVERKEEENKREKGRPPWRREKEEREEGGRRWRREIGVFWSIDKDLDEVLLCGFAT